MNIALLISTALIATISAIADCPVSQSAELSTVKPVLSAPDAGKPDATGAARDSVAAPAVRPPVETIDEPIAVRALPGGLDQTLMFNSNSPEVVQSEGILLSTFPPEKMAHPAAHLHKALSGRFNLFLHHISKPATAGDLRTLYLGLLLKNAGFKTVQLTVQSAASYLSQPDAPFIAMPPVLENQDGLIFAGPGDRVMSDLLRDKRQKDFPERVSLKPGQSCLLLNHPIPVNSLTPPLNGRSACLKVRSSGPVYAASLAMYAPVGQDGNERSPTLAEWQKLLETGALAGPREHEASLPGATGPFYYGRVAGVALGSVWKAKAVDRPGKASVLTIPEPGKSYCYVLSTVDKKTLGTNQVQSAPLVVRYPDTAYQAHGNYAASYLLSLPLYNPSQQLRHVSVAVRTPVKESADGLVFKQPPPERVFFRGTVRFRYRDEKQSAVIRYLHLVERQGELLEPLINIPIAAGKRNDLEVEFLYPPDATPPQVLTVKTGL
jgi:hypothetical protein